MRAWVLCAILLTSACDELFGLDPLPPPDAAIQPGDLALAYAFEDPAGSTVVADGSGNGNTAMLFGPAFEPGRYGSGLTFDGDDYAVAVNSPSIDLAGTGLTVTAWIRVDVAAAQSDGVIIGKLWQPLGSFAEPYWQYAVEFDRDSMSIALLLPNTSGVDHSVFPLGGVSGEFQHVAFSYDGSMVHGYLDAVELFTGPAQGAILMRDTQLLMGADGVRSQAFRGTLDNVRVYRRALAADEIAADRSVAL